MSFLSPQWLVANIGLMSLIIAGFLLVVFDNVVTRSAFSLADWIKEGMHRNIRELGQKGGIRKTDWLAKYLSEFSATALILLYAYIATNILADYLFTPILFRLRETILVWVIIIFLIMSYVVNNKGVRRMLMEI